MRLLWVARAPAPYRYPIWRRLSADADLTVAFLQSKGIGRTWKVHHDEPFTQVVLPAVGPRYREDALWVLSPWWSRRVSRPDVLVMQGMWETPAAWQVWLWARVRRVPMVYFSESTRQTMRWRHGPLAWARGFYMRQAVRVVTPGPAATRTVRDHGVPDSRIVTSVNVVDVARFHEATRERRSDRQQPDPLPGHVFIAVARMVTLKNLQVLLEAFADARSASDRLVLVGDGPLRPELEAQAARCGLGSQVVFTGALSESGVIEQLAAAHTLVLPSTEEVWGLVANEALAAGLHAVVSDRCGVAETVQGMRGVYVCAPDRRALAAEMIRSRTNWQGWIDRPEILEHDAEAFVAALLPLLSRQR